MALDDAAWGRLALEDAVLVEVSDEVAATVAMLGQSGQLSLVLGSL